MTPAIDLLNNRGIAHTIHDYLHESGSQSYGEEAATKLGVEPARVFKTLVVSTESSELAVVVVPIDHSLSLKLAARNLAVKKTIMADKAAVQRSTGYVLGGVSPLGQKRILRTLIDQSAMNFSTIFVSAGKRGLEIEIAPTHLIELLEATVCQVAQNRV
jgi:Cys-tRNA(Pro)/Cys-tRNA(Cys) deacylase